MGLTIPTTYVLKTAKVIGLFAYLIALIGVVGSYGMQANWLLANEVGPFSWVIPATVDLLAVCAAMALQLPGLDAGSRRIAGWILTTAVVVSVSANVASGHNTVSRLAHAWPVVAYLLGEILAGRVRAYAARLAATEAAKAAEKTATPEVETSKDLPEESKAPATKASRKPYGPRNGESYSKRHADRLAKAAKAATAAA